MATKGIINGMNREQIKALTRVVSTQEDVQKVWDNPRAFNFDKGRMILITLLVANENGEYKWSVSARLQHTKKKKLKPTLSWVSSEKLRVRMMLESELAEVGLELGREEFSTSYALHLNKKCTPEERDILLAPQLLGN